MTAPRVAQALAAFALLACGAAQAGLPHLCDAPVDLAAPEKDRRLRLVHLLREQLDAAGTAVALVSRSGVDLARFDLRYSHAGLALRDSPQSPWAVRQLYYACDEGRPRLFDQGLSAFLLAADQAPGVHVSVLLLPPDSAAALAAVALDRAQALELLAPVYSANAYPFSTRYQNCNQWVAEVLAAAWAPRRGDRPPLLDREAAQAWLREQAYEPFTFEAGSWLRLQLARVVPLLHHDDHPDDDLAAARFRVSMPASLEAFVQRTVPGAQRLELCHDTRHMVLRRGWTPLGPGCEPAANDLTVAYDAEQEVAEPSP